VAETGELRQAARRVHLSQPALSKSVAKLEDELGIRLFDRGGTLTLTALGEQVLERVRRVVAASGDLERELLLLRGGEIGELRIGCGPVLAECLLGRAVAALHAAHPGLHVHAQVGRVDGLLPLLLERQLDCIVGDLQWGKAPDEIEVVSFPEMDIVWFCRPGHPLAGCKRITPAQMLRHPLVVPALPPWAHAWFDQVLPASMRPVRPAFECSHYPSLVAVVVRSDAVCGSTRLSVADDLAAGRVVLLDLDAPPMILHSGVMAVRGRSLSPPGELLLREMVRLMGAEAAHTGAPAEVRRRRASAAKAAMGTSTRK
jgi:DNA-binding transcriptional LysR family regulator